MKRWEQRVRLVDMLVPVVLPLAAGKLLGDALKEFGTEPVSAVISLGLSVVLFAYGVWIGLVRDKVILRMLRRDAEEARQ